MGRKSERLMLHVLVPVSRFHYGGDAVLRDPEQSGIITQLLKGTQLKHTSHELPTCCL